MRTIYQQVKVQDLASKVTFFVSSLARFMILSESFFKKSSFRLSTRIPVPLLKRLSLQQSKGKVSIIDWWKELPPIGWLALIHQPFVVSILNLFLFFHFTASQISFWPFPVFIYSLFLFFDWLQFKKEMIIGF